MTTKHITYLALLLILSGPAGAATSPTVQAPVMQTPIGAPAQQGQAQQAAPAAAQGQYLAWQRVGSPLSLEG